MRLSARLNVELHGGSFDLPEANEPGGNLN